MLGAGWGKAPSPVLRGWGRESGPSTHVLYLLRQLILFILVIGLGAVTQANASHASKKNWSLGGKALSGFTTAVVLIGLGGCAGRAVGEVPPEAFPEVLDNIPMDLWGQPSSGSHPKGKEQSKIYYIFYSGLSSLPILVEASPVSEESAGGDSPQALHAVEEATNGAKPQGVILALGDPLNPQPVGTGSLPPPAPPKRFTPISIKPVGSQNGGLPKHWVVRVQESPEPLRFPPERVAFLPSKHQETEVLFTDGTYATVYLSTVKADGMVSLPNQKIPGPLVGILIITVGGCASFLSR